MPQSKRGGKRRCPRAAVVLTQGQKGGGPAWRRRRRAGAGGEEEEGNVGVEEADPGVVVRLRLRSSSSCSSAWSARSCSSSATPWRGRAPPAGDGGFGLGKAERGERKETDGGGGAREESGAARVRWERHLGCWLYRGKAGWRGGMGGADAGDGRRARVVSATYWRRGMREGKEKAKGPLGLGLCWA